RWFMFLFLYVCICGQGLAQLSKASIRLYYSCFLRGITCKILIIYCAKDMNMISIVMILITENKGYWICHVFSLLMNFKNELIHISMYLKLRKKGI
ncbi:hypothetical protein ACJX0J_031079, partial [Zea mays]